MKLKALLGVVLMSCSLPSAAYLATDTDKLSYSLGSRLAEHIKQFDDINPEALSLGIMDSLGEQEQRLSNEEIEKIITSALQDQALQKQIKKEEKAQTALEQGSLFLDENSREPGVITLKSGLQYKVINKGEGSKPEISDRVVTHYEGHFLDGSLFDSSYDRGQPASFKLDQVIQGWSEGLQEMPEGSTWMLYIPAYLAYGSKGVPGHIGANETLTFKVELKEVKKS